MSYSKVIFGALTILFTSLAIIVSAPLKAVKAAEVALAPDESNLEVWNDLRDELFDKRAIDETAKFISLDAPYRAQDAALVPVTIKAKLQKPGQYFKGLTLIIDNNPVPVAAVFELSPKIGPIHIETRIRVNQYSHVRAILETNDGQLYMVSKYVKAAGGCSAPAMKDMDAKMALLGKSKLRQFTRRPKKLAKSGVSKMLPGQREVQIMVRHPNYSGMQLNQETGYYIPAHYVSEISVKVDGNEIMKVDGAISLSEDPAIRFRFLSGNKKPVMNLTVKDTKGNEFKNQWQLKAIENQGS